MQVTKEDFNFINGYSYIQNRMLKNKIKEFTSNFINGFTRWINDTNFNGEQLANPYRCAFVCCGLCNHYVENTFDVTDIDPAQVNSGVDFLCDEIGDSTVSITIMIRHLRHQLTQNLNGKVLDYSNTLKLLTNINKETANFAIKKVIDKLASIPNQEQIIKSIDFNNQKVELISFEDWYQTKLLPVMKQELDHSQDKMQKNINV